MAAIELSRRALATISSEVLRPRFDPAQVRAGIVHLGLGGFHRAHMARYTHELMNDSRNALEWGIAGVGLLPADVRMRDALLPQQCLYSLVERQDQDETATIIGSVCDVVFAGDSSAAALSSIDDDAVRIVSLTVTENGYCLNAATKRLDTQHPNIRRDLADPEHPVSAIGIIVEACRRRMVGGARPFTVLSCDNIQHNGRVARSAVLDLASLRNSTLSAWIASNTTFPNTMVDRITPVTTAADIAYLAQRYGLIDRWPVFSERFTQWVIEDQFVAGRPSWEIAGAQFVEDVAPFEIMKLRLLNASHLAIAGLGRLANYSYIDESLRDEAIHSYMRSLMDRETGPTVPPVPGIDLSEYKRQLLDRFSNPKIKDTVTRVNNDAPLNLLIDPIRDRVAQGANYDLLALALAAWMRRVRGDDETGRPIEVVHPLAEVLRGRAIEGGADPRPLLSIRSLFGDLGDEPRFVGILGHWLELLYRTGARSTLATARREQCF